jgi:hypothetical protein
MVPECAEVLIHVLLQPPNGQADETHLLHRKCTIIRLYFVESQENNKRYEN